MIIRVVTLAGIWKSKIAICWIGNTLAQGSGDMLQGITVYFIFFLFIFLKSIIWMNRVLLFIVAVQSLSLVWLFATPWTVAHQASLSFAIFQSLLKFTSIESVMLSSHVFVLLPLIFPSIRVFSSELALPIRWPKYWSFSFSISPFNECSGLIFFRIHWFELLSIQGTLKSLLQHRNSKASVLWCSPLWSNSHICTWQWKNHRFD